MNGGDSYQGNTSVTVTATANEGYLFKKWTESGSEVSTDTSYTFTVSRDRALVAVFEKKEEEKPPTPPTPTSYIVSLGASPTAGGTISGEGSYQSGTSVTVTATPNSNYRFTGWTENGTQVSTSASYTFTVSTDRTLVAGFTYVGGSTNPGGNPGSGTTNPSTGNTSTTTPAPTLPVNTNGISVDGMTTTASPTATVRGDVATSVISSAIAQEIIKQAVANDSGEVVIAPVVKADVTKTEITLPAAILREIGQKTDAALVISTPLADARLQNSNLSELSNQQSIVVTTENVGNTLEFSITAELLIKVKG